MAPVLVCLCVFLAWTAEPGRNIPGSHSGPEESGQRTRTPHSWGCLCLRPRDEDKDRTSTRITARFPGPLLPRSGAVSPSVGLRLLTGAQRGTPGRARVVECPSVTQRPCSILCPFQSNWEQERFRVFLQILQSLASHGSTGHRSLAWQGPLGRGTSSTGRGGPEGGRGCVPCSFSWVSSYECPQPHPGPGGGCPPLHLLRRSPAGLAPSLMHGPLGSQPVCGVLWGVLSAPFQFSTRLRSQFPFLTRPPCDSRGTSPFSTW